MLVDPKVLLLSSDEAETIKGEEVLRKYAEMVAVRDLPELQDKLQDGDYDALFCSWSFQSGTWNDALGEARQRCPDLPSSFSVAWAPKEKIPQIIFNGLLFPLLTRRGLCGQERLS
jgi:hypothetical protein